MSDTTVELRSVPRPVYKPLTLQCPQCTGLLERLSEHSQLIVCPYCNERLELTQAELRALGKEDVPEFDQFTLPLNSSFVWEDITYTIIGRMSYLDEDGSPAQKDYLLFHPEFGTLWATEYWGYGYYVTRRSRMLVPTGILDGTVRSIITSDGSKWTLSERETYTLEYVDGALPWVAKQGDQVELIELKDSSRVQFSMSIERTLGVDELECSISQQLHKKQWKKATGQYTKTDANREMSRGSRIIGIICSMIAAFLMSAYGCATVAMTADGNYVATFSANASELQEELVSPSFVVSNSAQPIAIKFHGDIDNEWIGIQYALLRTNTEGEGSTYSSFITNESADQSFVEWESDITLSYYYGYEGGENWTEGSRKAEERVLVSEPGIYRLMWSTQNSESVVSADTTFTVSVMEGSVTSFYYWLAFCFSLGIGTLFWLGRE